MPAKKSEQRTVLIALTGGIGTGKSTVAALLGKLGARVIDTDKVAHDTYHPGTEGFAKIVAAFGREIVAPDGTIDRQRLAQLVFTDPRARQRLNGIVHPLVAAELQRRIAEHLRTGSGQPLVIEIPLLVESASMGDMDQVWVVTAKPETVIARLVERGLPRSEVLARIASQASDEERLKYSTVVIENDGEMEELERRVRQRWVDLTARGQAPARGGGDDRP